MPPHIFVLLLEGKTNFKGCGTVTMPSAEAIAQASPDVVDRFQAIEMVDLSGMDNLAGELRGPKAPREEPSQEPSSTSFLPTCSLAAPAQFPPSA